MTIEVITESFATIEVVTEPINLNVVEVITEGLHTVEVITEAVNLNIVEVITEKDFTIEVITEFDEDDEDLSYKYPTWLELYRQDAISLMYQQITSLLAKAFTVESYGKPDECNYEIGIRFNSLINYCAAISLRMREDEYAGFVRTPEYYYTIYKLPQIIEWFKCKNINIKPVLTAFHIDEYNKSTYNYEFFNWAYNVDTVGEITVSLGTFRDYYTGYSLSPTSGEDVHPISGGQVAFATTHPIKNLVSFLINGNDRIEKVSFSGNLVSYTPSGGVFPYDIENTDTVIINYTYEL